MRQCPWVAGSYDQKVRLWDMRMPSLPTKTAVVDSGGGVWRVKWHPKDPDLILGSCMHGGFTVLRWVQYLSQRPSGRLIGGIIFCTRTGRHGLLVAVVLHDVCWYPTEMAPG